MSESKKEWPVVRLWRWGVGDEAGEYLPPSRPVTNPADPDEQESETYVPLSALTDARRLLEEAADVLKHDALYYPVAAECQRAARAIKGEDAP